MGAELEPGDIANSCALAQGIFTEVVPQSDGVFLLRTGACGPEISVLLVGEDDAAKPTPLGNMDEKLAQANAERERSCRPCIFSTDNGGNCSKASLARIAPGGAIQVSARLIK